MALPTVLYFPNRKLPVCSDRKADAGAKERCCEENIDCESPSLGALCGGGEACETEWCTDVTSYLWCGSGFTGDNAVFNDDLVMTGSAGTYEYDDGTRRIELTITDSPVVPAEPAVGRASVTTFKAYLNDVLVWPLCEGLPIYEGYPGMGIWEIPDPVKCVAGTTADTVYKDDGEGGWYEYGSGGVGVARPRMPWPPTLKVTFAGITNALPYTLWMCDYPICYNIPEQPETMCYSYSWPSWFCYNASEPYKILGGWVSFNQTFYGGCSGNKYLGDSTSYHWDSETSDWEEDEEGNAEYVSFSITVDYDSGEDEWVLLIEGESSTCNQPYFRAEKRGSFAAIAQMFKVGESTTINNEITDPYENYMGDCDAARSPSPWTPGRVAGTERFYCGSGGAVTIEVLASDPS